MKVNWAERASAKEGIAWTFWWLVIMFIIFALISNCSITIS